MNGSHSYEQRNSIAFNKGENLFVDWCLVNNYTLHRLGFDEKQSKVAGFYKLASYIRHLPDFIVSKGDMMALVEVKGSTNFKESDYERLGEAFYIYSTRECPLYYVFATDQGITWKKGQEVAELYEKAEDQQWDDGVTYRRLW